MQQFKMLKQKFKIFGVHKFMNNKKGMTSTVFNWVFIAIAGALIMLFFFKIITTQTEISENEITARIVKDMEDILVGKAVSTDSASEVKISEKDFEFKCEEPCNELTGCNSWLGIKKAQNKIELNTQPVFTIENLRSDKIYAFTQGWDVPFHTTNFLYIAIPGEKIIFPTDCDLIPLCNKVFTLIPQKLKDARIVIQSDYIEQTKYKKYVEFGAFSGFIRKNEIVIDEANGQIHFYEKGIKQSEEYYFLEESIIGAIFTQDHKTYSCNMKKAFYKLKNLATVLEGKRGYFETYYTGLGNGNCVSSFLDIKPILPFFDVNYESLDAVKITDLKTKKQELIEKNNQLRRFSCSSQY